MLVCKKVCLISINSYNNLFFFAEKYGWQWCLFKAAMIWVLINYTLTYRVGGYSRLGT